MDYDQFKNMSCYEEFEIQCTLAGISKVDALYEIGHQINGYYFFISTDGIFNWFDLEGNHIEDPHVLKLLKSEYIPYNITRCIVPDSVTCIDDWTFSFRKSLTSISIPNSVIQIGYCVFYDCTSLTSITIPNSITNISNREFHACHSLKEVIFKGKTLKQVKQMYNYPFGIKDKSIIKCEI